jgi:hypothetical protein
MAAWRENDSCPRLHAEKSGVNGTIGSAVYYWQLTYGSTRSTQCTTGASIESWDSKSGSRKPQAPPREFSR